MWFVVWGLGFRVWWVWGLEGGGRVSDFGLVRGYAFKERVSASLRVSDFGLRGYALKQRVRFSFQDSSFGFQGPSLGTCLEGERIFIEHMRSDCKLKASREGSK